jgi:hypothetical protein
LLAKSTLKFSDNINLLKSTAAIYNGKIVETGAKELPLIHIHMNSNLIFDCGVLNEKYQNWKRLKYNQLE